MLMLATITFNTLPSSEPAYIRSLLKFHTPARSLRSSDTNLHRCSCSFCIWIPQFQRCFTHHLELFATQFTHSILSTHLPSPSQDTSFPAGLRHLAAHLCASDSAFADYGALQIGFIYLFSYNRRLTVINDDSPLFC